MTRIWFNQWFSTCYHIIRMIKEDREAGYYVIGSSRHYESVVRKACDEWYEEPSSEGEEYINFCLDFCKEHDVDMMIPRRNMMEISKNKKRFEEIGVRVMADDYDKISIFNDKAQTYEIFRDSGIIHVPEYAIANTPEEFKAGYLRLRESNSRICMKLVTDEGGKSFRIIEEQKAGKFEQLSGYPGRKISYEFVREALEEQGKFPSILLAPYLSGSEISVDGLLTKQGPLFVPRIKSAFREEEIVFDGDIIRMCEEVLRKAPLLYPCNIQFRMEGGQIWLLEVNTRMSGGIQMGCLAAGVNIPLIAVKQLLGKEVLWSLDKTPKKVTYIEHPILL